MVKSYNGKDITEWSLEDLKKEFTGGYEDGNYRLNALNDLVNEKLLEIHKLKQEKNRLLMLDCIPELMALYKKREAIKPYGRMMKLKVKTLKMLYGRRHDKRFMDRLGRKLEKKVISRASKSMEKDKNKVSV